MRAGPLNKLLVLESKQSTQGDDGGEVIAWVPVATVWASIEPVGGREAMRANQIVADTETRIKIRWSSQVAAIDATWRAVHGGTIYNIKRIANIKSANREIELMCESGVTSG